VSTFSYTPDFGGPKSSEPSVRIIKFGDGYEQRQAFGINTIKKSWDLTFAQRENADADIIEAFFEARGATESFTWTPPYESTAIQVVCRNWTRVFEKASRSSISAKFEQVYEP
jgi:phage-related protein